ncbi:MAG: hypothetical protein HKO65_07670 [Gemmatimonadetes bacterium]|nr:hypothetical protein [Gemmatimonadota bacterium]NNM04967.1 hypothetical protein [Gemmatimonadota bacterium]
MLNREQWRQALGIAFGFGGALMALGCDDATGPDQDVRFTFSVMVSQDGPLAAPDSGLSRTSLSQSDGTHALTLDRVEMVLREVELKRISDDDCDDLSGSDHDACEAFEIGPILLDLPLDGSVAQVVASEVPPDTYDELEFDIHKPEDDIPADFQFLQDHPGFKGVSIRVEGTFDGESFVFRQDLNGERELDLVPPLVVEEGFGAVNLTLELDVGSWFRTPGNALVDPRSANKGGINEDLVEENIRASIQAFPDSDRDGIAG